MHSLTSKTRWWIELSIVTEQKHIKAQHTT